MEKVIIILSLININSTVMKLILLFIYRKRYFNTPVSDDFLFLFGNLFDLKFIRKP